MPDETTLKWQSVLEILSDSTELSTGKLSIIRMTRVIDVDGTLVLVAGSPFTKSKVEEARATISRALTQVWGRKVPFEVTVDTSLDAGAPTPTMTVTRPQARPVQPRLDLSSTLAESDAPEPVVRARPPAVEPPMAPGATGTAGRHALQSSHSTRSLPCPSSLPRTTRPTGWRATSPPYSSRTTLPAIKSSSLWSSTTPKHGIC